MTGIEIRSDELVSGLVNIEGMGVDVVAGDSIQLYAPTLVERGDTFSLYGDLAGAVRSGASLDVQASGGTLGLAAVTGDVVVQAFGAVRIEQGPLRLQALGATPPPPPSGAVNLYVNGAGQAIWQEASGATHNAW